MKKGLDVPLSRQALAILAELQLMSGQSRFLFPVSGGKKSVQASKLNLPLRRLGYSHEEVGAHGFRSTASTILNQESDFSADAIELCLGHGPRGVRGIYNRSLRWPEPGGALLFGDG